MRFPTVRNGTAKVAKEEQGTAGLTAPQEPSSPLRSSFLAALALLATPYLARADDAEIAFGATGVLQGSSGADTLSPDGDVTDASLSFDIEIAAPVGERGSAFAHIEAGLGDGIDGEIPTLSGLNDDADDAGARLTELWYEHACRDDMMRLRVGMVDLSTDFDANAAANSETDQFLSGGFVNSVAVEFPGQNGPGAMLWFAPCEFLDVGIGLADADADWEDVFERPFAILEVDFKPNPGGRRGTYRVYGWLHGADHVDLTDAANTKEKGYGFGISLDQQVSDAVTVFARYGWERADVYQVAVAWSVGLRFSGAPGGREGDGFGLAYGVAVIGDDWKSTSAVNDGDERRFEIYYRFAVNDSMSVSPDVQWVGNPGGDADSDDVWAFGVRTQMSF